MYISNGQKSERWVVSTRHANYYDDSDFFAVIADDRGGFREIMYNTTRFAGGGYAEVDAPPSLMREYRRWRERRRAREYAQKVEHWAQALGEIWRADKYDRLHRLLESRDGEYWLRALALLARATRSAFRLSLRAQVVAWLQDECPKHSEPLSARQLQALMKYERR